jgi:enterochelin esterase-like enzyme
MRRRHVLLRGCDPVTGYRAGVDAVGPSWDADAITFRVPDPDRRLTGVRLVRDAGLRPARPDFTYDGQTWQLTTPLPDAWRLEYRLELRHASGDVELVCDPANPLRVGGAFGERSVLRRSDYAEPGWLHASAAPGAWHEMAIPSPMLAGEMWTRIWSPRVSPTAGIDTILDRTLVVNDGPEYDKLADLGQFAAAIIGEGRVRPFHLVLLGPGARNEWYSANPAYARALAHEVLPRVRAELGIGAGQPVIGMGTSLGALAILHAQRLYPRSFSGLFLQSGSFFQPRLDPQESAFPWFERIKRFTRRLDRPARRTVPIVMTCGRSEENLANNRETARRLNRQGYPVELHEVPDAHNYTGWRDAFEPYLVDLLRLVWPLGQDGP